MRKAFALAGAAMALVLSATVPSQAGDVATRCNSAGCDRVHCNYSGNRCVRFSDYDSYYNGYTNGYDNGYGGYYGGYGQPYDNGYDRRSDYGSSRYDDGYYGGYDGGYGGYGHVVCDRSGARCYDTAAPYWDYREYYRLHGYRWDRGYRY